MKSFTAVSLVAMSTLMLAACTTEPRPAPGQYETTSERVDRDGTVHKTEKTTNIYYDKYGNMKGSVDSTTTTDPKGLFNKSTAESHKTIR